MRVIVKISLVLVGTLLTGQLFGQSVKIDSVKGIYGFIGTGADSYSGDLSGFEKWTGSIHFGVKFNRYKRYNGNIVVAIGSVIGQDPFYSFDAQDPAAMPNLFFKTTFTSINYEWQYNILNKTRWKAYIAQGAGLLFFTPKDEFDAELFDQNDTRASNETYGSTSLILPTSIGVRYVLKKDIGLEAKWIISNVMTDYIDNISQWGNKSGNDNLMSFRISALVPLN